MLQCGYTCFKTAKEKPLTICPAKLSQMGEWSSMSYLYSQQVSFLFYHYDKFLISAFKHKMYTVLLLSVVAIQYNPWTSTNKFANQKCCTCTIKLGLTIL